jgi:nitrite reductase (NO-forming)
MQKFFTRATALAVPAIVVALGCGTPPPPPTSEAPPPPVDPTQRPIPAIDVEQLPTIDAELGVPPTAAPPTHRSAPAHVRVQLEVQETTREIADGVTYTFWTYGGTVPGPMFRVRRGDYVELHLANRPDSTMPHNIDLHAVTGPGGGATSTFTAPGHQTQFSFQALNPGVYIYHCATPPVGMHVANGMYGLIVVEPEDGYPEVDHEYYVVQGDFYTQGDYREPGLQPFSMERAIHEDPAYILFNGRDGSLVGDHALTADVGQTVRIFFGVGGPNLTSSFHVIGEIFDRVWPEGGSTMTNDVQTTSVPPGGSAVVDFRVDIPGNYILVDHALIRAFNHGALGMLRVAGDANTVVYSGRQMDETYLGEHTAAVAASAADGGATAPGEATFIGICSTCHQRDASGIANVFPPLAHSDFLMADRDRAIHIVLAGLNGPVTVNGQTFNGVMPPLANLTDHEVADVLTYVRTHFGNTAAEAVTAEQVAAVRATLPPPPGGHP